MRYLIQLILLISSYCYAFSNCDPIVYKDTNYYSTRYREDSTIWVIGCFTDSFYCEYWYHPNGKIAKERFNNDGNFMMIYNSWDTLGNPLVVNGNGYQYDYYNNGKVKSEGFYKNYLQNGTHKYYNQNGRVLEITNYRIIDNVSVMISMEEYYNNKMLHRRTIFNDKKNKKDEWPAKEIRTYNIENGNLSGIGIVCADSIRENIDSLNCFFYSKGYVEVSDVTLEDNNGIEQHMWIWKEPNLNYQFNRVWYNDGTIRMKFEYDTLEKVLKYYEFHSNARLKTTGNVRYFSLDDIGENCPVKFKEEKHSHTKQLYGYLKCDIWKEYDELGNVCSETNMNNEFSEERKIFFDDVDTDE